MDKLTDKLTTENWVGCDLEVQESGQFYRGQIERIEKTADGLHVIMRWCATLRPDGRWHYDQPAVDMARGYFSFLTTYGPVSDIGQGRMVILTPIGIAIFYPREVSRLNPAKVHGLPPEFAEPDFVDPKD